MGPLTDRALALDAADPLAKVRERFVINDEFVYLDGNSLGRLPKATIERMRSVVEDEWAHELVLGWSHWLDIGLDIGAKLAPLIGAAASEVVLCDQTSVNLYKLAVAGLRHSGRTDIITDEGNFPSDRFVLGAIASAAGGRLILAPEDPTAADVRSLATTNVGLVSFSHVGYRSGAMLNAAAVTQAAHDAGALMLWDLAHSAGAVPVELNAWGADLAVGCTYKYLNGGPGAPAFLFVSEALITELEQPMSGWYGHEDQFAMAAKFIPAGDIRRFVVGTPPIVSMVGADEGIRVTAEVGMAAIRTKSLALTDFFIEALGTMPQHGFTLITPGGHEERGSQITIQHPEGYRISLALRKAGVIPDFRAPDLIRFGFTPLYTTFGEAAQAADVLDRVMSSREYEDFEAIRMGVT
ncbi:MAG: kynureninase [Actinomycetota bacterium]|nr:kynureninase [Actinomycetota bacterium]